VVALAQFDIDYSVAALGTATTAEHIQMLFRAAPEIICCYDGDRAGREAAWRALENALPYLKDNVEMKFLFLPDGEDPDSLVRKTGKAEFEQQLDKSVALSQFFFDNLLQRHHVGSVEGKASLEAEASELIDKIHAERLVVLLQEELRKKINKDSYRADILKDINNAGALGRAAKVDFNKPAKSAISPIRKMIRLLLIHPSLAAGQPEIDPSLLQDNVIPGLSTLVKLYQYCLSKNNLNTGMILEYFRDDEIGRHLAKLLQVDHEADEVQPDKLYKDCFSRLIDMQLTARYEELRAKGNLSQQEKQEFMLLAQSKTNYSVE
jgi:DNA primase